MKERTCITQLTCHEFLWPGEETWSRETYDHVLLRPLGED